MGAERERERERTHTHTNGHATNVLYKRIEVKLVAQIQFRKHSPVLRKSVDSRSLGKLALASLEGQDEGFSRNISAVVGVPSFLSKYCDNDDKVSSDVPPFGSKPRVPEDYY